MTRLKAEDDYSVMLRSPAGGSEAVWGQPVQIPAREVPDRARLRETAWHIRKQVWDMLFVDVCLRLEQTTARHALAYPFESFQMVQRAYSALYDRFNQQRGPKSISMRAQKDPPVLYIRRGSKWKS